MSAVCAKALLGSFPQGGSTPDSISQQRSAWKTWFAADERCIIAAILQAEVSNIWRGPQIDDGVAYVLRKLWQSLRAVHLRVDGDVPTEVLPIVKGLEGFYVMGLADEARLKDDSGLSGEISCNSASIFSFVGSASEDSPWARDALTGAAKVDSNIWLRWFGLSHPVSGKENGDGGVWAIGPSHSENAGNQQTTNAFWMCAPGSSLCEFRKHVCSCADILGVDAKNTVPSKDWKCFINGSGWIDVPGVTVELVGGWGAWKTTGESETTIAKFLSAPKEPIIPDLDGIREIIDKARKA